MANQQDQNQFHGSAWKPGDRNARCSHSGGGLYEIHVKGHLNGKWSEWLEGLEVKLLENGEMILSGIIVDQAALMGILNKLNRLNLALLSVIEVDRTDLHKPDPT